MSLTLVTFFFDISQFEDANKSTRPLNFYLENGKASLSQPYPMILFCDPKMRPAIQKIRDEACPGNHTHYIEKSITDYEIFKNCWSIVKKNREGNSFYVNHRNTISYFILMHFKMQAMKIAYDLNYFNTTHYAWIDFGGGHICKETMTKELAHIVQNLKPKITACYIHYRSPEELKDMKKYISQGPCAIAGNFWTIEASYLNKAYLVWNELFYKQMAEGVGHTDEQTLTYMYDRYPELFTLTYGDYTTVYSNYVDIQGDYHQIRWFFIQQALNKGAKEVAKKAILACLESSQKGKLYLCEEGKKALNQLNSSVKV